MMVKNSQQIILKHMATSILSNYVKNSSNLTQLPMIVTL